MTEIQWVPLLSAFAGAMVGALASIGTIFISSYQESKRQLRRLAYEAAIEDHREACALAKQDETLEAIPPLTAYIHYHIEYMRLVSKGRLTKSKLDKLNKLRDELFPELGEPEPNLEK